MVANYEFVSVPAGPSLNDIPYRSGANWQARSLSAQLDAVVGSTRGSIMYRGSALWSPLAPGTSGQVLKTGGAGADPSWTSLAGTVGKGRASYRQVGTSPWECWYAAGLNDCSLGTTQAFSADAITCMAHTESRGGTIDRIGLDCTAGNAAGRKARVAIYKATSATNLYPDALVVDSGDLDCSTTGVKTATISVALEADTLYWMAFWVNNAGLQFRAFTSAAHFPQLGVDSGFGTVLGHRCAVSLAFGSYPDPFTAGATVNTTLVNLPLIAVRYSA